MGRLRDEAHDAKVKAALAKAIERAKEIDLDASKSEMEKRYTLGALAKKVRDDAAVYGDRALEKLAKAIGRDRSTVFRAASIATYWTRAEVNALSSRRGRNGIGIRWSHLEVASTKTDERARESLLERVLREGLTVRALKRAARPNKKAVPVDEATADVAAVNATVAVVWPATVALRSQAALIERLATDASGPSARGLAELRDQLAALGEVVTAIVGLLPATETTKKSGRPDKLPASGSRSHHTEAE